MRLQNSTRNKGLLAAMAFIALAGCKSKGDADQAPPQDQSLGVGNGTNLGAKPGSGGALTPSPTPVTAPKPGSGGAIGASPTPVPAPVAASIGGGRSTPPTVSEWASVGEVTVRNSTSLGCETKMVREWLRVSCRALTKDNSPRGVQVIRPTGNGDYFVFNAGGVASLVMPVRSGVDAEARYTWEKWGTRTLRVTWPPGAPSASMGFDRGDR